GRPGVLGNGSAGPWGISMSADGLWIAFSSYATDLVDGMSGPPGGTFPNEQLFLYSRLSDTTRLVSVAGPSGVPENSRSLHPMVSADGEVVAFQNWAPDTNSQQVYAFQRTTGALTLVSHAWGSPLQGGNGWSGNTGVPPIETVTNPAPIALVVSADGSHVAFNSLAPDLGAGSDVNGKSDVFLYSVADGSLRLVSRAQGRPTTAAAGYSWLSSDQAIRQDGEAVAFSSDAPDLVVGAGSPPGFQAWIYDSASDQVTLASRSPSGSTSASFPAFLSTDGNWAVFGSLASDLVPADLNAQSDVFLFGPLRAGADLAVGVAAPATVVPPASFEVTYVVVN